jgi:membrane protein YqaA with SNARE-associated domain
MWWEYALVFLGAVIVDITPLPLPPAFSLMIALQVIFGLSIWPVIILGVAGSAIGRLILAYYIPSVANRLLTKEKNNDIRLLGEKLNNSKIKGQLFVLIYTLMPLSSTPLFIASGIARLKPLFVLPAFIIGKFTSDSIAVFMGAYATANTENLFKGNISYQSVLAVFLFLLLMFLLLFINWRVLLYNRKIEFKFNIWKKRKIKKEITAN